MNKLNLNDSINYNDLKKKLLEEGNLSQDEIKKYIARIKSKIYYQYHREEILNKIKIIQENKSEPLKKYFKNYYQLNKEKILEKTKEKYHNMEIKPIKSSEKRNEYNKRAYEKRKLNKLNNI
jgi:hypothetical protein